jgi:hypothetical protein
MLLSEVFGDRSTNFLVVNGYKFIDTKHAVQRCIERYPELALSDDDTSKMFKDIVRRITKLQKAGVDTTDIYVTHNTHNISMILKTVDFDTRDNTQKILIITYLPSHNKTNTKNAAPGTVNIMLEHAKMVYIEIE